MGAETLQMIVFYAAILCIFGSALHAVGYLISPPRFNPRYANAVLTGGVLFLTVFFLLRWRSVGFLPVSTMFESLVFFILALAFIYFIVEYFLSLPTLSSFILPVMMLFALVAACAARGPGTIEPRLKSIWFLLHVAFAFVGYASFTIAFAAAVMYLLQRRQLKSKKSFDSVFHRLPSLEVLDNVNRILINMGFPLFTIAIAIGIYWAHESKILGPNWPSDPKIVFTGITWLLYIALFHIRLFSLARGRRVAQLTIVAFVFVVLTFLGAGYFTAGPHDF